jgi:hypothetical protein
MWFVSLDDIELSDGLMIRPGHIITPQQLTLYVAECEHIEVIACATYEIAQWWSEKHSYILLHLLTDCYIRTMV